MSSSGSAGVIRGAASMVVQRPLCAVFDFAGHRFFENYTRWSPQVVEFEPFAQGSPKAGMRARQTTLDRGVRTVSTFEIASFVPPRSIRLEGVSEPFVARYDFEKQSGDSTLVSFSIEVKERRLFMRPFRQFLRESLDEGALRTVENLKRALERDHAAAQTPEPLARFIYVTSLDLQEPLRKIEAFSDLLENALASSNKSDMAYAQEAVRGYAATARKLVDDLLLYSDAVMGGQRLETLDLQGEIASILQELDGALTETGSEVSVRLPAVRFEADRSQFACLVRNAVEDATLRLEIADSGVGFEEAFAQAVFEPFRPAANRTEYPGTGIELAICKSIADRHGWGIDVKTRPGEGAAFHFAIPIVGEELSLAANESTHAQ